MNEVFHENHKRTQQGVSDTFLHYLYYRYIVYGSNKQPYSKVYASAMSIFSLLSKRKKKRKSKKNKNKNKIKKNEK